MKKITTLVMLFVCMLGFAQTNSNIKKIKKSGSKITSISYSVDSVEELKTIDWDNLKSLFEINKADEIIEMSFGVNFKKSKYKLKSSITLSSETKNIDSLILRAKEVINGLVKLSKKYENK